MIRAISFAAVAHQLDIADRPRAWQHKHLRFLVAAHGFPAPLPASSCRSHAASLKWDPRAVDHWFDERAGSSATLTADQAAAQQAAALLDYRAAQLAGVH